MIPVGSPVDWANLLDAQVPVILDLVVDTWPKIAAPAANEGEDSITNRLCAALQSHPNREHYLFHICPQSVILEPTAGKTIGRMDIAFKPFVPSDKIYFCLECKRLNAMVNGGRRAGYVEYVRFGMLRFVTGQYASSVRHGGMLAYVLNGNVDDAMAGVEVNIRAQHHELGIDPPGALQPSSLRPKDKSARETNHRRTEPLPSVIIHHLFVAADETAPISPDTATATVVRPKNKKHTKLRNVEDKGQLRTKKNVKGNETKTGKGS